MIAVNGRIVAQGSQFSLSDVEVVSATVDIEDVRAHRTKSSRSMQAAAAERYPRIEVSMPLSGSDDFSLLDVAAIREFTVRYHTPEEEIACVQFFNPVAVIRLNCFTVWDQRVGFGTICGGLEPKATLFHSAGELIAALPLLLCIR
jgi:hypothetical protein